MEIQPQIALNESLERIGELENELIYSRSICKQISIGLEEMDKTIKSKEEEISSLQETIRILEQQIEQLNGQI